MIEAHGGRLVDRESARDHDLAGLRSVQVSGRIPYDVEMIGIGGFSPLDGFLDEEAAHSVVDNMQLKDGTLWTMPVLLPIATDFTPAEGERLVLMDGSRPLAIVRAIDKFRLDLGRCCQRVFGVDEEAHVGVRLFRARGDTFMGCTMEVLLNRTRESIRHERYTKTPKQVRQAIAAKGWNTCLSFQSRNPLHSAHEYMLRSSLQTVDGCCISPLLGTDKPGDIPFDVRVRCHEAMIANYFNEDSILLHLVPSAQFYGGPREALHHQIVRQNYGGSHYIAGRDKTGVGGYYGTYEAQEFMGKFSDRLASTTIKYVCLFYCHRCGGVSSERTCPHDSDSRETIKGTIVREMCRSGQVPPSCLCRPEVAAILLDAVAPRETEASRKKGDRSPSS